jgi:NAD(P)-dependent dehydrogenase (short-subunit alcohol dehydrogenase family)
MKGEETKPKSFPPETQDVQPGIEKDMKVKPEYIRSNYKGSDKLLNKVALITGGDSGIGRSVAVHFAREGADVAICYKQSEQQDAEDTKCLIQKEGRRCLLLPGNLRDKKYCEEIINKTVSELGKLNILVNNAAVQYPKDNLEDITDEQLEETFDVNILSFFRVTRAALKHLHSGDSIINTTSINAYKGHLELLDYTSTKGAITAFTRALSAQLAEKKIRVNAVAPGPIWTPLIVASFPAEKIKTFGQHTPLGRAGQPSECGTCFVFLASDDATYITGQCLHPNGGNPLNT